MSARRKPPATAAEARQVNIGAYQKYGAQATWVDGIRFASKREAARYQELELLERAGQISRLALQPKFPLEFNGVRVGTYIADFSYKRREDGLTVVEDVKGIQTPVYRLKKKLMWALYAIEVQEVP